MANRAMLALRGCWNDRWERYAGSGTDWPWRWKIVGACTARFPAKSAAWWINRQLAREDYENIKIAWAEPYLWFWVIVNFFFEEDGVQYGHFYINRKPETIEEAYDLARTLVIQTEAKIILDRLDNEQ